MIFVLAKSLYINRHKFHSIIDKQTALNNKKISEEKN